MTRHIGLGKVILLGEHAVVYGYPALVAALDRGGHRCGGVPTPAGGTLRLDVPEWQLAVHASSKPEAAAPARALAAIAEALGVGRPAVTIVAETQLPPGAGIGSSAALAVATTRALAAHARIIEPARAARDRRRACRRRDRRPSGCFTGRRAASTWRSRSRAASACSARRPGCARSRRRRCACWSARRRSATTATPRTVVVGAVDA